MKQSIFTLALSLFAAMQLCAQTQQFINFQAVARDNSGNPIINQGNVGVTFTIRNGNQPIYSENQTANTDACGMFSLRIGAGNGSPISFGQIDWSNGSKFLEVKVNGTVIGDQQMVSVPYALYAEKTKLQQGAGISITGSEIANSGDLSNTNELQTISFNSNNNTVSLSENGGSFQLPSLITIQQGNGITVAQNGSNYTISNNGDNDNNSTNEIQTLNLSGNTLSLSQNGGSVQLPQDGDGSPTNEIQTLSVSGSSLTLSNGGGTVNLPASPAYVPDIAIFEERRPHNSFPGNTILIWNTRQLNITVLESTSNTVELTNNSLKFNKTGKYLITASAPGYYTGRHRLVLKSNDPDKVKIFGTSELSTNTLSPQTRSHIMGILEVTAVGATYRLDHYVDSGTGNGQQLGVETNLPQPNDTSQDYETYAQIMVQKI